MANRYRGANDEMRDALARVAPGTPLRDGIDRVVRAKAGALLVLDDGPDVLAICSGGFLVDAPYSPQRLSELAKMDGAIIISTDGSRIARANVHLVPDPTVPTSETGTRHRTAERVARSLKVPVVSASEEMGVINVYAGGSKHQLQDIGRLLDRANQALQTLERYKVRLDDAIANLTGVELEDVVSLRDVVAVVQRGEMVHRISDEIETMIIELGVDARLLRLQLDELYGDIDDELDLVVADYLPAGRTVADTQAEMSRLERRRRARPAGRRRHAAPRRRQPRPRAGGRPQGPAPAAPRPPPPGRAGGGDRRPLRRAGQAAAGDDRRPHGRRPRRPRAGDVDQGHARAGHRVDDPRPVQLTRRLGRAAAPEPEPSRTIACDQWTELDVGGRSSRRSARTVGDVAAVIIGDAPACRRPPASGPAGPDAEVVVLERTRFTSYSACGIPFLVGGPVAGRRRGAGRPHAGGAPAARHRRAHAPRGDGDRPRRRRGRGARPARRHARVASGSTSC